MPPSPFGHSHRQGDCYATWYAHKKAVGLIGCFGFSETDVDDIEQSLIVGLLERWPKFNPKECSAKEFISWAIGRTVADQIREQQRRHEFEPTETEPIEQLFDDEEQPLPSSGLYEDHVPHIDRSIDLAQILTSLPPEIQAVGELLMSGNITNAARELGISRRTVRDRMQKLRLALEAAGYEHA